MEVTEKQLLKLIKSEPKLVLKIWSEDCPFCKKLAPIFDKAKIIFKEHKFVSLQVASYKNIDIQDRDLLLTVKKVAPGESGGLPATLVYENGALKHKHHGYMDAEALLKFLETGERPVKKAKETQQTAPKELTYTLNGTQADQLHAALMEVPAKYSLALIKFLENIFTPQAQEQLGKA